MRSLTDSAEPAPEGPSATSRRARFALIGAAALTLGLFGWVGWTVIRPEEAASAPDVPLTRITFTGTAGVGSVSPDGSRLAFAERQCGQTRCRTALAVQGLDGSDQTHLLDGFGAIYDLDWATDGDQLLLLGTDSSSRYGTWVVSAAGNLPPRFLGAASFAFFAGGDSLWTGEGRADGSWWMGWTGVSATPPPDTVRVELPGLQLFRAVPSRDARWTVVQGRRPDGTALWLLVDRGGTIRDHFRAAFLWRVNGWSPDGRAIVFAAAESGQIALKRVGVSSNGRFGSAPQPLLAPLPMSGYTVSPAGIVYTAGETKAAVYAVERANPGAARLSIRLLPDLTGSVSAWLSPRGNQILIARDSSNTIRYSIRPFQSGTEESLTESLDHVRGVAWSAEGRRVTYLERAVPVTRAHSIELATRKLQSATIRDTSFILSFQALRNGEIAWTGIAPGGFNLARPDSAPARILVDSVRVVGLAESPWGPDLLGWGWVRSGSDSLVLFRLDLLTRRVDRLYQGYFERVIGAHWLSRDTIELAVLETQESGALYHFAIGSRRLTRVADLPFIGPRLVSFSNDGRRLLVQTLERREDVWLARVFGEGPLRPESAALRPRALRDR